MTTRTRGRSSQVRRWQSALRIAEASLARLPQKVGPNQSIWRGRPGSKLHYLTGTTPSKAELEAHQPVLDRLRAVHSAVIKTLKTKLGVA